MCSLWKERFCAVQFANSFNKLVSATPDTPKIDPLKWMGRSSSFHDKGPGLSPRRPLDARSGRGTRLLSKECCFLRFLQFWRFGARQHCQIPSSVKPSVLTFAFVKDACRVEWGLPFPHVVDLFGDFPKLLSKSAIVSFQFLLIFHLENKTLTPDPKGSLLLFPWPPRVSLRI